MTNPKLGSLEFKNEICQSMNVEISRKVAYLAKRKALSLVEGSVEEQFGKIRNYCAELIQTDRDATVILKLTEDEVRPRFQRMYVCFSACGQLLSAVGLDPNNNIFPICYALVEGETKDTWMWFLRLLAVDINLGNDCAWTFMSHKQKGLIPALDSLFPNAEHRFCVRHMHSNMKNDGYKSVAIKNALWDAAKATTVQEFRKRMQELKEIDRNAYEWLAKKHENHWSKAFFSTIPKCDILLNNMCECFNSLILDAREKSIIEMFEAIRNLLMRRFQLNREKAEKWNTRNYPRIRAILAKISLEAAKLIPMKSDDMHFQIKATSSQEQHTVDLSTNSCSCRQWDLTGIPCKHALCALWCKHEDVEAFVSHYYKNEACKKCYSRSIMSINGPDLWPDCVFPPPLPPAYNKNKAGRPAKLRRREPDEPPAKCHTKLKAPHRQNKCKRCGHLGAVTTALTDLISDIAVAEFGFDLHLL
ncbi:hypothetical protein ZIOFF_046569 [Zingiber officinale]|uniref:SWIM-type domain-containing protein n=1 Tax=Zingiber officinale TaxID=94328 RepID=A0A8J5FQ54_ZINOF|nr:hypothetical protein ZIOFF_046569 [Zingiber officinale]